MPGQRISESRPWRSRAIGCLPQDAAKNNEMLKEAGAKNVYFDPNTGHAVAHSTEGRNTLMKLMGAFDLEGGYSDHCGK